MEKTLTSTISFDSVVAFIKNAYVTILLSLLGLLALVTATLVAWPALAYLLAKLI